MTDLTAPVAEVFSSLQGEGLHLGERQIFIRFAGCPWRCRYCDTPDSLTEEGHPRRTVAETLSEIDALQKERPHGSVSVTGGEPLLRAEFLEALLPEIKGRGFAVHLETSATHPELFRRVAPWIDVVAGDIKPPSAAGRPFWAEHEEFFRLAGEKAFAKLVLTQHSTDEEIEETVNLLLRLTPTPPLVLQPVTPIAELNARLEDAQTATPPIVQPPAPARLAAWWEWTRQKLPVVKLVSQMHPVWGLP